MKQTLKKPFITITIAALNEEKIISKTLKECFKLKKFYNLQILVILDSKTTDNTAKVAKKLNVSVIQTGKWQGKGAALRKAMKFVKGEYTVQLDADYQFMPFDIPKMIKPLQNGYDVTLATRYEKGSKVEGGSVTKFRRFGILCLSFVTSLFCGQRVTDVLAGFKAFKTSVLKDINIQVSDYGYEAEEVIKAAQKGYKIKNVPITYKARNTGKSNLIPLIDGFNFLTTIIKLGFRF